MDQQKNWDPGVKRFFLLIVNTVALIMSWMIAAALSGIYFKLGFWQKPFIYPVIFYILLLVSLFFLVRYLNHSWKDFKEEHD